MLDWCKNRQHNESQSEIYIALSPTILPPPHQYPHEPPKFSYPSQKQIRKLRPTPRRANPPLVDPFTKADKQVQTSQEPLIRPAMVDSSTQTRKLSVQLLKSYRNGQSMISSREPSPTNNLKNSVYLKVEQSKHIDYPIVSDRSFRQSGDYKPDYNAKTKATHCLADTKDRMQFCDKSKLAGVMGVESYHLPSSQRLYQEYTAPCRRIDYHESQLYCQSNSNMHSIQQREVQSENQLTFSTKYRQMLRNVQNQFKRSQQKSAKHRSLKNIKCTPERPDRRLLYQRETILSKFTNSNARSTEKEIPVEQSIIVQREAISLFTLLSKQQSFDYFTLCIAKENGLGLIVSIKEVSIVHMEHISEELLIYKEIGDNAIGLLKLYQTQIDHNSYLFIKEPYSNTLESYVEKEGNLTEIMQKIQQILEEMYRMGYFLRRELNIHDFVEVFSQIKIQNAAAFTLDHACASISVDEAVLALRSDLLQFFT